MTHQILVSAADLVGHIDDPSWAIVDCRFDLVDLNKGEAEYQQSHIPGAVYAHLERDLSATPDGKNGRHPLPPPDVLAARFSHFGIGPETQVVAYDSSGGPFAARLWWSLHWLGHQAAAVLDGGFPAWQDGGYPLRDGVETRPQASFHPSSSSFATAEAEEILARLGRGASGLIDARAPERFLGQVEPLDPVAGHIPSASNYFWQRSLDAAGRFRPAEELRAEFETLLQGESPEKIITYCGSGVTGAHLLLAMLYAGLGGPRLYPGSWSEWSSDPSRPVAAELESDQDPAQELGAA